MQKPPETLLAFLMVAKPMNRNYWVLVMRVRVFCGHCKAEHIMDEFEMSLN